MDDAVLNEKIRALRRLKHSADELRHNMAVIEEEIQAEMTARAVDELITLDYKVTWKAVASTRLDTKALKEERPEIYARYARRSESKRFVVS